MRLILLFLLLINCSIMAQLPCCNIQSNSYAASLWAYGSLPCNVSPAFWYPLCVNWSSYTDGYLLLASLAPNAPFIIVMDAGLPTIPGSFFPPLQFVNVNLATLTVFLTGNLDSSGFFMHHMPLANVPIGTMNVTFQAGVFAPQYAPFWGWILSSAVNVVR